MEKVIRNGNVAVLVSPGYGAGWYSWHDKKELLYHPEIVKLVEEKRHSEITEELCQKLLNTDDYICVLGADSLKIYWIKQGTNFKIREYDGHELVETLNTLSECA